MVTDRRYSSVALTSVIGVHSVAAFSEMAQSLSLVSGAAFNASSAPFALMTVGETAPRAIRASVMVLWFVLSQAAMFTIEHAWDLRRLSRLKKPVSSGVIGLV